MFLSLKATLIFLSWDSVQQQQYGGRNAVSFLMKYLRVDWFTSIHHILCGALQVGPWKGVSERENAKIKNRHSNSFFTIKD